MRLIDKRSLVEWNGRSGDEAVDGMAAPEAAAAVLNMKESKCQHANQYFENLPSTNFIALAKTNAPMIDAENPSDDVTLGKLQAAYHQIYGALDTGTDPLEDATPADDHFQPSIPIHVDYRRFMPTGGETAMEKSPRERNGEVSVGNWSLEDLWRERGITICSGLTEVPPLKSPATVNEDPILSPEELREYGLAPRSYDYLFENSEQPMVTASVVPDACAHIERAVSGLKDMKISSCDKLGCTDLMHGKGGMLGGEKYTSSSRPTGY